jgi:hypothetical protein
VFRACLRKCYRSRSIHSFFDYSFVSNAEAVSSNAVYLLIYNPPACDILLKDDEIIMNAE